MSVSARLVADAVAQTWASSKPSLRCEAVRTCAVVVDDDVNRDCLSSA